ncbi:MAG: efflux RND transporter periplasmic adaptor subunit [Deltaproteobacteria bacterium]|nr:efflux RND transporter periplasmic adaptor subunit [Deltaproteobacteria bacterium]
MAIRSDQHDLTRLSIDRRSVNPETSTSRRSYWFGGIALLALLIGIAFFTRSGDSSNSTVEQPTAVRQTQSVAGAPATRSTPKSGVLSASGYVVAQRKAAVSSKATGRIRELRVVEGDKVKAGDTIAILENEDLEALVTAELAGVRSAQARVTSAKAELANAELNLQRITTLRGANAIAITELDAAQMRAAQTRALVAVAESDVSLAEARLEKSKVDLDYTIVRAPFDGTVLTKSADIGEIVAPFGSSTNARAAVVTLADMESLQVEADVSEANVAKVFIGQRAEITLDSYPEKTYFGTIVKIVPTVDRAKATVLTKIRFESIDERVLPEMSAKITLLGNNSGDSQP